MELKVKGTIPAYAAGTLWRNGPGASSVENTSTGTHQVSHWFDGFAHVHKFDIYPPANEGGTTTVTYSSRRQAEDMVADIKKGGWRTGVTFAQKSDPCVGIFAKAQSFFKLRQMNHNVGIQRNMPGLKPQGGPDAGHRTGTRSMVLTTDQGTYQDINPDTLEPSFVLLAKQLHPDLTGPSSCAHPQQDVKTGDVYSYNLDLGRVATYRFFRVNAATGKTDILATVSEPDIKPAYIHSFFMSENYIILMIPSSHFAWYGAKIPLTHTLLEAMVPFDKANRCKWIVVDRKHDKGVVARFSTPAGFFFHSINAFEEIIRDENNVEQVDLCLDYIHFDSMDILSVAYYDILLNRNNAAKYFFSNGETLNPRFVRQRFRMPVDKQRAKEAASATAEEDFTIHGPHTGELPTINPANACKPYRYVFSTSNRGRSTIADALVKTDLHTREALLWCGERGHCPGEPIFIARPDATEEDDGVILSVVLAGGVQKSYLLCLDAKSMTETGRAEAEFAIAIGLHGVHAAAIA